MRSFRSFVALVLAAPLVLVFSSATTELAQASGTVTKTITVYGANGSVLPNALVAIGYDDVNAVGGFAFTPTQTTNSSGVATITGLPQDGNLYAELDVQAPVGDTTDAAYYDWIGNGWDLSNSSSINVHMSASTFVINPKTSAGAGAALYTTVGFMAKANGDWYNGNLLRAGAMGFYVDPAVANFGGHMPFILRPWPSESDAGGFYWMYVTASGNAASVLLKDAYTFNNTSKTGEVWNVMSSVNTFTFQIVDPAAPTTRITGSTLNVCVTDPDGGENCFAPGSGRKIGMIDGAFKLRVDPASTSNLAAAFYTAVVSNGGTSVVIYPGLSASGTPLTPDGAGLISIPAAVPNFYGNVLDSNGTAFPANGNQWFNINVSKLDTNNNYQYAGLSIGTTSHYAFKLTEAGSYKIEIRPWNLSGYATMTQSSVITVANNGQISYANGSPTTSLNQNIQLLLPNFKLKILNPLTSAGLNQGFVNINTVTGNNETWYTNADIQPNSGGNTSANVPDGTYRLHVNPPNGSNSIPGLTEKIYTAVISSNGSSVIIYAGSSASGTPISANGSGVFELSVAKANLSGVFVDASGAGIGSANGVWINACLQSLMDDGVNWNYVSCTNTTSDGHFYLSASTAGTYRILLEPQGRADIASTFSSQVTIAQNEISTYSHDYGNVTAKLPTVRVRVRVAGGNSDLQYAGVEVRQNNQFVQWANTTNTGLAPISLSSAGTYTFVVHPDQAHPEATQKTYVVTATSVNNVISATIEGVSAGQDGTYVLNLGTATLMGKVLPPTGTTGLANSQVVATDLATNRDMWDYSTGTNQSGLWSMSLPAGRYSVRAQSPWGSSDYGNSNPIPTVVVDSSGVATLSDSATAYTADHFDIRLSTPYWTGTIKSPDGSTAMTNARVCLNLTVNGQQSWNCANTDSTGHWAMSKPNGFVTFDSNSEIQVAENQNAHYSMSDYKGLTAIEATGFLHTGAANINLRVAAPNVAITVMAGSQPATNIWVNLNNANNGAWIGGSGTDSQGVAHFSAPNLVDPFRVQIDTSGNPALSTAYATTIKNYASGDMSVHVSNSVFIDTITLATPNVRGVITDPATNSPVAYTWIELFDATTGNWIGGSNSDGSGYFALNAPSPVSGVTHYRINVNPQYGSTSTSTKHSYTFDINSSGALVTGKILDEKTNESVTATAYGTTTAFPVTLLTPSVTGFVKDPTGATGLSNSWVVPMNSAGNIEYWQSGMNSGADGHFGLSLANGTYQIYARAPYGTSSYSSSPRCSVIITNGVVSGGDSSCVISNSVILKLRAPNLTVHVTGANGALLQNVNVGIGVGMWNTNAQTDANGDASLFVDSTAIGSASNGSLTGAQNITMWIDPPYGTSDYVRTQCYSLQAGTACANLPKVTIGTDFSSTTVNVAMATPNTSVIVKDPTGSTLIQNAWVTLFEKTNGGWWNWLGGGNTDATGTARFNLDSGLVASGHFIVQVDAPWNQKSTYAAKTYDGVAGAGLVYTDVNTATFNLSAPNLILNVTNTNGVGGIATGWVGVEYVDGSNNPTSWFAGYGLDQQGITSLSLPSSSRLRITANPGPGVTGVQTYCVVTTDGSGVVSKVSGACATGGTITGTTMSLQLATGNTSGTITGPSGPVAGAIVYANIVTGGTWSSSDSTAVITSTNDNGTYSMQLDPTNTWRIKVTPVNTPSDTTILAAQTLTDVIFASQNATVEKSATLSVA